MKSSESLLAEDSTITSADRDLSLDRHLFNMIAQHGHEQVSFSSDRESGYRGIIAIHDTTLGPALGGTRFWNYDTDAEAFTDVLRLSRSMTYKAAVAGLNLGGGKSVILGNQRTLDRGAIFRAHGRHIQSLRGRYITAEDVGTSPSDMEYVREETDYVVGLKGGSGDPSPVTAFGVYRGILACLQFRYGSDDPSGKTVALQGLGHVGYNVCRHLHEGGAELVVTDIDDGRVKRVVDEFGARGVKPEEIYEVDAQVFAPCALGGVINDKSLEVLKVEIVAGAANNQLAEDRHGDALYERDVIYAPDYVINGGGLISVNGELEGWETDRVNEKTSEIYDTVLQLLEISRHEGVPTYQAARRLAERRIAASAERSAEPA